MATSTGKKEYTLKINGIAQNIKDVTKLEATLNALDAALNKTREANLKAEATTKATTKGLTEEEKAAKKLADTQKRIEQANSEANRAQIAANQELRERTREVTRNIAINNLAEGSIRQMGMQLTDLRNEYESLTAAQRADEEQGGKLLVQIQALDAEYKALRESTGNFRDSVGNYEKGFKGLNELKDKFELAARGSVNLAADVAGSNDALDAFGATTDTVAKSSEQLAGVMALAGIAQEAYNAVIKEGIIQQKAAAIMDGVRALQLKAKAAAEAYATRGTIAATAAQWALNVAASANPYVLLALALVAVGAALFAFVGKTDKAAQKQKELNDIQALYLDLLDAEAAKIKTVSDQRVLAAQNALDILNASGAKTKEIQKAEDQLARERQAANARQRGFYAEELAALEANRAKVEQYRQVLLELQKAKAQGDEKLKIDVDLDGDIDKVKIEDAITAVQGSIDNLGRSVQIAVDLKAEQAEIEAQAKVLAASRAKADRDLAKERADKAREARATELSAVRAGEDARIALIENSYERQRKTVEVQNRRAIEDLKLRLATESNLTAKARKAINDNIKALEIQRGRELKALADERAAAELDTLRQLEDSRTGLILGEAAKREAEINAAADRAIQDLQKRLDTEKELTARQQAAITEQIINAETQRGRDLAVLRAAELERAAAAELAALDSLLARTEAKIGDVRVKSANGLVDVDATRANLAAVNEALGTYVDDLQDYAADLKKAHEATLATLKEGTPEYVAELQKYSDAVDATAAKIKAAQKEQNENTKQANDTEVEHYRELFTKIGEYAQIAAEVVGNVLGTFSAGMQFQVDQMTAQLEIVNEAYDKAGEQREAAVENVKDLEAQIQGATGGTAKALQEQLAASMVARNEAEREERRLAKEKEKREAEIARKEKQIRRNDLLSNIAGGIANTAQGITKALTLAFPLNLVVAGIVGAMGAIQVGIMTKQLTKLATGGRIIGPSHANGGVNIGAGYEAEGNEFVVRKESYLANPELVEFINASKRTITGADLAGVLPSESAPVVVIDAGRNSDDRIIDAIAEIEFKPVVAVTDIRDVMDEVTTVEDLAGF